LCDTALYQSRDNIVVKSQTPPPPSCGILQQYYPFTEIIRYHTKTGKIFYYPDVVSYTRKTDYTSEYLSVLLLFLDQWYEIMKQIQLWVMSVSSIQ